MCPAFHLVVRHPHPQPFGDPLCLCQGDPGSSNRNSSPPLRHRAASGRRSCCIRVARAMMTASPTSWPKPSLMALEVIDVEGDDGQGGPAPDSRPASAAWPAG